MAESDDTFCACLMISRSGLELQRSQHRLHTGRLAQIACLTEDTWFFWFQNFFEQRFSIVSICKKKDSVGAAAVEFHLHTADGPPST
jgi:hypothetical protein